MILRAEAVETTASLPDAGFGQPAVERRMPAALDFDELVARLQGPLLRFLYGLVGDRDLAADLCQETFLSAFRAAGRLDPQAHVDAWLYTIALNHARGVLRRRRLLRWVPFVSAVHDRAVGRDLASGVAAREQLREVLETLPVDQRAALLLHAEGFRYAEIAAVLGCSAGAVKLRIFRARRAVLERYGPAAFEEDA